MSKRLTAFVIAAPLVLLITREALPCGWVLLRPPAKEGFKVDRDLVARVALSLWTQERAFDTAEDCETLKARSRDQVLDWIKNTDQKTKLEFSVYTEWSKCVPFDAISDKFPFRAR